MLEKIPCIIIDDEESNILLLEYFIIKFFKNLEVKAKCKSFESANEALLINGSGIVFLDIELGSQNNGFDLLRILSKNQHEIIVVTAYSNYAIEGFELNVTDYILKPVVLGDMRRAINRAVDNLKESKESRKAHNLIEDKITIHLYSKIVVINQYEIVFIESDNTKMFIHLRTGEKLESTKRIGSMEEVLNGKVFSRVHKSYIVNLSEVRSVEYVDTKMILILNSNQKIPVSRRKKRAMQQLFS